MLYLVREQEVRQNRVDTEPAREYTLFYGKENADHEFGTGFLRVKEPYQQLRLLTLLVT
jgi:hypothetical protein